MIYGMRGTTLKEFLDKLTPEQLRSFVYVSSMSRNAEVPVTGVMLQTKPGRIVIEASIMEVP